MLSNTILNSNATQFGVMAAEKKKPVSPESKKDAKRLKDFIAAKRRKGEPVIVQQLATLYGVHRSAPGQYVNGTVALNDKWKRRFANFLGCASPRDIWPDWIDTDVLPSGTRGDFVKAVERLSSMPDATRDPLVSLILSVPLPGSPKK